MPNHHPTQSPTANKPTGRQQAYIRKLALERGISFTPPATKADASRLIKQLLDRKPDRQADQRRDTRHVQNDLTDRPHDAVAIREHETTGHGSSATWNTDTPKPTEPPRRGPTNPPVELARYPHPDGERLIQGQRVLGVVRVTDIPATGHGRRFLIERELTSQAEIQALVSDYLHQAEQLQDIPALHQPEATR